MAHYVQIMSDEEKRHIELFLELSQQFQNLGLDRNVEGGCRFVGDEKVRFVGKGHGDHDPLLLTARELVGKRVETIHGLRKSHETEEFHNPIPRLFSTHILVDEKDLDDLPFDAVKGIKGAEGFLKDHGDLITPNFLEAGPGCTQKFLAPETDASPGMIGEGVGEELKDRQRGDRFAGTAFSYEPQSRSTVEGEGDAANGPHLDRTPAEGDG